MVVTRNTGTDCGSGTGGGDECNVSGGALSFDDGMEAATICADGSDEGLVNVNLSGNVGTELAWVITDRNGVILDLPSSPPFDFRDVDAGICLIWGVSYQGELEGARIGGDAFQLGGLLRPIQLRYYRAEYR